MVLSGINGEYAFPGLVSEQNYAHSFRWLCARLYTKLAVHTLYIYLNRLLANPDWLHIKDLAFTNL